MDIAALHAEQIATAGKIVRQDDFSFSFLPSLSLLPAPMSAALSKWRSHARRHCSAAFPSLELLEYQMAHVATTMPCISGFLSFCEYPALLAAWDKLGLRPDLLLVGRWPWHFPRRFGVASYFGLLGWIRPSA